MSKASKSKSKRIVIKNPQPIQTLNSSQVAYVRSKRTSPKKKISKERQKEIFITDVVIPLAIFFALFVGLVLMRV